jgi:hypothetical protein
MESLVSRALVQVPFKDLERPELASFLQDAFSRIPIDFYTWCQQGYCNHIYLLCQSDYVADWEVGVCLALQNGHIDVVKILLEGGATNYNTVLYHAIRYNNISLLVYMITRWSSECNWDLAIRVAVAPTCMPIIHMLIDYEVCDWDTVIFMASREGNLDMIDMALHNGARIIKPAIDVARFYERSAVALYIEEVTKGLETLGNHIP